MRGGRLWILIGSLLGLCLVVSLASGAVYYLIASGKETGPVVLIKAPRHGEEVSANEMTQVQAIARDPSGVIRVELWADGQLATVKTSQLPKGSTPFPLLVDWQPESVGKHILVVRAYDSARRSGQASVIVEAEDLPGPEAFVIRRVEEGKPVEGAVSLTPKELQAIAEERPELAEALEAGEVALIPASPDPTEEWEPPPPEPPQPLEGEGPPEPIPTEELLPWMLGMALGGVQTFEIPAEWVEVEGISLEVDKEYEGVYCYVSLGDLDTERVPSEGFLPTPGGHYWEIETSMGEENRKIVPIPEGRAPLVVTLQCLGFMGSESGGVIFDLGTLLTSHPEEEWDGRRLERLVRGEHGWFRVAYRITEAGATEWEEEEPFPRPRGLSKHCFENPFLNVISCVLSWNYPEEHLGEISGYIVVRNDTLYVDLPLGVPAADWRELPLFEGDGVPPCGESYEYHVIAYQGDLVAGPRSGPSNTVVLEGDVCPSRHVTVTFETLNTACLTGDCAWKANVNAEEWSYGTGVEPFDPDGCRQGHCDLEGEYYACLWANEHEVPLGGMNDFGILYNWDTGGVYSITNIVRLDLSPSEYLEIGMELYDYDNVTTHDTQCDGGYVFRPDDLQAITYMPDHKQTFTRFFSAEGSCWLVFSIEVVPTIEALEHPGGQWPPSED